MSGLRFLVKFLVLLFGSLFTIAVFASACPPGFQHVKVYLHNSSGQALFVRNATVQNGIWMEPGMPQQGSRLTDNSTTVFASCAYTLTGDTTAAVFLRATYGQTIVLRWMARAGGVAPMLSTQIMGAGLKAAQLRRSNLGASHVYTVDLLPH